MEAFRAEASASLAVAIFAGTYLVIAIGTLPRGAIASATSSTSAQHLSLPEPKDDASMKWRSLA